MKEKEMYSIVKKVRDEVYKKYEVEVGPEYKAGINNRVSPKNCYEKSYQYIFSHNIDTLSLVHGYSEGRIPIPHAWVEFNNVIFDGVYQRFYDKKLYSEARKLIKVIVYSRESAINSLLENNNYGPWGG